MSQDEPTIWDAAIYDLVEGLQQRNAELERQVQELQQTMAALIAPLQDTQRLARILYTACGYINYDSLDRDVGQEYRWRVHERWECAARNLQHVLGVLDHPLPPSPAPPIKGAAP